MWKIGQASRTCDYVTHMDENFGAGHLGQTVLPTTVSYSLKKF